MLPLAIGLHAGFAFIPAGSFDTKNSQKKAEPQISLTGIPVAPPVPLKVAAPPLSKPPVQLAAQPQPPAQPKVIQPSVKPVVQEAKPLEPAEKPIEKPVEKPIKPKKEQKAENDPSNSQANNTSEQNPQQGQNNSQGQNNPLEQQSSKQPDQDGASITEYQQAYAAQGYLMEASPLINQERLQVYKLIHRDTQQISYAHFLTLASGIQQRGEYSDLLKTPEEVEARILEQYAQS
ncbi:MAG: hypothetical protein B0A82_14795 [Alkalinema sp. CACIAM 70d]|nr:MAG: hypothetical protein B0A82_14795 [Alkalinema sp. CACIAM 70d]